MRACHVDLQERAHHVRQGAKQTLGASDATVYDEIVIGQDHAVKQRLHGLGLSLRSAHRSATDAALALDRGSAGSRLVHACMHACVRACSLAWHVRSEKTDVKGLVVATCPHYCGVLAMEAEEFENHAHYLQMLEELFKRFGVQAVLADIACRLKKMWAAVSRDNVAHGKPPLPAVLQSLLHGSFHDWVCLVVRGFPWNFKLGRMTGEETERLFSWLLKLDGSLSQSSRTRRVYLLDSALNYNNTYKLANMGVFLQDRYARVVKDLAQHVAELGELGSMSYTQYCADVERVKVGCDWITIAWT